MPAYFDSNGNFVGDEDRPSIDDPPYVPPKRDYKEIHHQGALGMYSVRVDPPPDEWEIVDHNDEYKLP